MVLKAVILAKPTDSLLPVFLQIHIGVEVWTILCIKECRSTFPVSASVLLRTQRTLINFQRCSPVRQSHLRVYFSATLNNHICNCPLQGSPYRWSPKHACWWWFIYCFGLFYCSMRRKAGSIYLIRIVSSQWELAARTNLALLRHNQTNSITYQQALNKMHFHFLIVCSNWEILP